MRLLALLSVLLILAGLFSAFPAAAAGRRNMVRIGLKYGAEALVGHNVFAEYGFDIGYYTEDFQFVPIFTTEERFLCFAKDDTLRYLGNELHDTGNGVPVGAFHAELATSFESHEALRQAMAALPPDLMQAAFPAYLDGVYKMRLGSFASLEEAEAAAADYGQRLSGQSLSAAGKRSGCTTIVNMNTGMILFEQEQTGRNPAVLPKQKAGAAQALLKNSITFYYGAFEFCRTANGNLSLISTVHLQDYLKGVVCFEMSDSWPVEALKVQAVCARGFAVSNCGRHKADGFDLCNTTHCQVYKIYSTMEGAHTTQAVEETNGMVLTYGDAIADTYYFASTGGFTESNSYVWGGTQYPYLLGVADPYQTKDVSWKVTKTPEQISASSKFPDVVSCKVLEYSPNGYAYKMELTNAAGQKKVIQNTDRVRTAMGLRSAYFKLSTTADLRAQGSGSVVSVGDGVEERYVLSAGGKTKLGRSAADIRLLSSSGLSKLAADRVSYVFDGAGYGHGIGMSQEGALGMAKRGMSYETILKHYFTGTELAVFDDLKS